MRRRPGRAPAQEMEGLVSAVARSRDPDALLIRVAADRRLLEELRTAYAMVSRPREEGCARLQALCREHGIRWTLFERWVFFLAHVLHAAPAPNDPYAVLDLEAGASAEEIKRAFRRLSFQWHPDRNPGCGDATAAFLEIQNAYKVLCDPAMRRYYEERRTAPESPRLLEGGGRPGWGKPSAAATRTAVQVAAVVGFLAVLALVGNFQDILSRRYFAGRRPAACTVSSRQDPAAVPAAGLRPGDGPSSREAARKRIETFLETYRRAYTRKDLHALSGLFEAESSAGESPRPVLRPLDAGRYERAEAMEYDIRPVSWRIAGGVLHVLGRYSLRVVYPGRSGTRSQGTVELALVARGESFRIRSIQTVCERTEPLAQTQP